MFVPSVELYASNSGAARICQPRAKARERSDRLARGGCGRRGLAPAPPPPPVTGRFFENSCMKTTFSCTLNFGPLQKCHGVVDIIIYISIFPTGVHPLSKTSFTPIKGAEVRGGGGLLRIWFRRGCAAEAAKPVYPSLRVIFGEKGTHCKLGVCIKKITFLCTLATKWAKII